MMVRSKAQIDARLALRSRAVTRGRRAVFVTSEALHYRYESQKFFHLDFVTFIDLFTSLTSQQLARVANAPEVIEASTGPGSAFDSSWSRLYQEGREKSPVWAALSLVEAAHYALAEALRAQSQPPLEVINKSEGHVKWLKNILCHSESSTVMSGSSAMQYSGDAHGKFDGSRKRKLGDEDSPSDVEHRESWCSAQFEHDGTNPEVSSLTCSRHVEDSGFPTLAGVKTLGNGYASHTEPLLGFPMLEVDKLTTSRILGSTVSLSAIQPPEDVVSGCVANSMLDDWITKDKYRSATQPRQTHHSASSTTTTFDNPSANDTVLNFLPWPIQSDPGIYNRSIIASSGTTTTTSPVMWTEVPCASNSSSALGTVSRTFGVPSPQL